MAGAYLRSVKTFARRLDDELNFIAEDLVDWPGWDTSGVVIPQELWDAVREMHLFGEAGSDLLRAIYRVQESRELITKGTIKRAQRDKYADLLIDASRRVEAANKRMRKSLS